MEVSGEQSAELVPHPYYPPKYIHGLCHILHLALFPGKYEKIRTCTGFSSKYGLKGQKHWS